MPPACPVVRYVRSYNTANERIAECHRLARWIVTRVTAVALFPSSERETPPDKPVASKVS